MPPPHKNQGYFNGLLGLKIGAALPVVAFLAQHAEAAQNMRNFDPNNHEQFKQFMEKYEYALDEAIRTDDVGKRAAEQLAESFIAFCRSIQNESQVVDIIEKLLTAQIAKHYAFR